MSTPFVALLSVKLTIICKFKSQGITLVCSPLTLLAGTTYDMIPGSECVACETMLSVLSLVNPKHGTAQGCAAEHRVGQSAQLQVEQNADQLHQRCSMAGHSVDEQCVNLNTEMRENKPFRNCVKDTNTGNVGNERGEESVLEGVKRVG